MSIVAIVSFNISFGNNMTSGDSITLPSLKSFTSASAEDPPDGYVNCNSGNVTTDGIPTIWCGDCKAHWVWTTSSGYCNRW